MEGVVVDDDEEEELELLDKGMSSQFVEVEVDESTDLLDLVEPVCPTVTGRTLSDLSLMTTKGLCGVGGGGVAAGVIGRRSDGELGAMGARCFFIEEKDELDEFS